MVRWKTEKTVHRNKDLGQEGHLKTTQEKTIRMIDLSPDIALKIEMIFNKGPEIMKLIEQDPNQGEEETKILEKDTGNNLTVCTDQDQETHLKICHAAPDPKEGPLPGAMAMMTPEAKYFLLHLLRHKKQLQKCSRGIPMDYHRRGKEA